VLEDLDNFAIALVLVLLFNFVVNLVDLIKHSASGHELVAVVNNQGALILVPVG
jgi:hypothetical protein